VENEEEDVFGEFDQEYAPDGDLEHEEPEHELPGGLTPSERCMPLLQTTNICGIDISVYGTAEEPLFLLVDVCEVVEYDKSNGIKLLSCLLPGESMKVRILRSSKRRDVHVVTELGLYRILFRSGSQRAVAFQTAIAELLKGIRTRGIRPQLSPKETVKLAMEYLIGEVGQLTAERDVYKGLVIEHIAAIDKAKPDLDYLRMIKANNLDYRNITNIAADYGLTAQKLNKILHEHKIQYPCGGQWILRAAYKDKGFAISKDETYKRGPDEFGNPRPDGIKPRTVWLKRGQIFLHTFLTGIGYQPTTEIEVLRERLEEEKRKEGTET
jgi:anti-repressor protein